MPAYTLPAAAFNMPLPKLEQHLSEIAYGDDTILPIMHAHTLEQHVAYGLPTITVNVDPWGLDEERRVYDADPTGGAASRY